jgi:NAD(P)-dependent dehydrogenase (short-subunit alcohol dehydrogenase family)
MAEGVVVVTGASAGVGRAVAREFARTGAARIALLARGRERLEAARREVEAEGAEGLPLVVDVADANAVEAAAGTVEEELGPIDVWVNNAMTTVFSRFEDVTPDEFRRATEVTYLGYVWGTRSALRRMRPRNRGVIVQVGSALAYRGIPLQTGYCGAKHAIQGFTEALRCELIHDGVDVHLTEVHLPAVNTPQFGWSRAKLPHQPQPVPPIFQPEVAARGVVWAARHRRRDVWVGWPTVQTIVGNKLAPAFADLYLAKNGVESQMTDDELDGEREGNLFEPVAGDFAAHGRFDDRARPTSRQLWWTLNRDWFALAGGAALAAAGALRLRR